MMRKLMTLIESVQVEHDGDAYFDPTELSMAENQSDGSRDTLIHMSPEEFLSMAMYGYDEKKWERVWGLVQSNTKFNSIPFLGFVHSGEGVATVTGHEGRHRARALVAKGVKSMPVLLSHRYDANGQSIRWKRAAEKDHPDAFHDDWPEVLYGQSGDGEDESKHRYNKIPFPVSDPRLK